jgi:hypothetical protein
MSILSWRRRASQVNAAAGPDWYAEATAMREAMRTGRAFNAMHIPTSYKVDLLPATSDFHAVELQRARGRAPANVPLRMRGDPNEPAPPSAIV